jgi:hypothetical protein
MVRQVPLTKHHCSFWITLVVLIFGLVAAPELGVAETLLFDSLNGSTSGNQNSGSFTGGGWQAPEQISWDLGAPIFEGSFSVEVTNWNPNSDSSQHQHGKQHIINMYEEAHGSAWDADSSDPQTGFFNIRTGASYDNCFKFLSSPAGFEQRHENRIKKPYGTINPAETHIITVEWDLSGNITVFLDGVAEQTHEHGQPFALRYVFIGTDNTIPGTYGPQHDIIYKNLVVTDGGGATELPPDPPTEPEPTLVDDAEVVSTNFASNVACGSEVSGSVTMRNTGSSTWTRVDSFKLGAVDDNDPLKVGDMRVWLDPEDSVPPGAEHTFVIPMEAGDTPEAVTTDWQMVHEGVTWFGESSATDIQVFCGGETTTPEPQPDAGSIGEDAGSSEEVDAGTDPGAQASQSDTSNESDSAQVNDFAAEADTAELDRSQAQNPRRPTKPAPVVGCHASRNNGMGGSSAATGLILLALVYRRRRRLILD